MGKKLSIEEKQRLLKCLDKLDNLNSSKNVSKQKEILDEVTSNFADVTIGMISDKTKPMVKKGNNEVEKIEESTEVDNTKTDKKAVADEKNSIQENELKRDLFLETIKGCIEIQGKCLEFTLILLENAPEEYSKTLASMITKNNELKKELKEIMKGVINTL